VKLFLLTNYFYVDIKQKLSAKFKEQFSSFYEPKINYRFEGGESGQSSRNLSFLNREPWLYFFQEL